MCRVDGSGESPPNASVAAAPGDTERPGGGVGPSTWRGKDSNLRRLSHLVYSQAPLTAREPRPGPRRGRATGKGSDGAAARPASAAGAWTQARLAGVAEPLRLGQRLELLERVVLDLPDPLARDVERPPDLLERARPAAGE